MPKFPDPPGIATLRSIKAVTYTVPAKTVVTRIFSMGGNYPTMWDSFRYFGPTSSRFDHHLLDSNGNPYKQSRGVMYLATGSESIPTCLAEFFQTTRIIDRSSGRPVLVGFELEQPVTLLDLTGSYATAIGASMAINSGPRPRARRWAQQLYESHPDVQGLLYASSMYGNNPSIALFERAINAMPPRPIFHRELSDPAIANVLLETSRFIQYRLI